MDSQIYKVSVSNCENSKQFLMPAHKAKIEPKIKLVGHKKGLVNVYLVIYIILCHLFGDQNT